MRRPNVGARLERFENLMTTETDTTTSDTTVPTSAAPTQGAAPVETAPAPTNDPAAIEAPPAQDPAPAEASPDTPTDQAGAGAVDTGRRIDPSQLTLPKQKAKSDPTRNKNLRRRRNRNEGSGPKGPEGAENEADAPGSSAAPASGAPARGERPKGKKSRRPKRRVVESGELYAKKEPRRKAGDVHVPELESKPFVYEGPAFADLLDAHGGFDNVRLQVGDKVIATLIHIGGDSAFFSLNASQEAAMALGDFLDDEGNAPIEVGDTLTAFVTSLQPGIELSKKLRSSSGVDTAMLEEAHKGQIPVEGKVTALNKGGLNVDLLGARAFCPIGQVELGYCEDASGYVGQTLTFVISEIKEGGKNIVVSRRKLLEKDRAEQREEALKTLAVGVRKEAEVTRMADFGVFVDLGGIDALVPISELAHNRVGSPSDVVSVGDKIMVEVLKIEPDQKRPGEMRISASRKATLDSPLAIYKDRLVVGEDVPGTVTRLQNFGAFVELFERNSGLEGLVHISELADKRVRLPSDVVSEGESVTVRILSYDLESERISLSLKDAGTAYVAPGEEAKDAEQRGYRRGAKVTGVVDRIERYGVFVRFEDEKSALLPRPETLTERGVEMQKAFKLGDSVEALVIEVDERGRIKISQRALKERDERAVIDEYKKDKSGGGSLGTLGDLLGGIRLD